VLCVYQPEYKIADPICTFVFSFLVLCSTLFILRDILLIILEGELICLSTLSYKVDLVPGTQESSSAVSTIQRFNTVGWVHRVITCHHR